MNLVELKRSMTTLRLSGMAESVETRILEAQTDKMAPLDFASALVSDELTRRSDRFIRRRLKQAEFRDPNKTLDAFDFDFNKKMNRRLLFELATGQFVDRHEDALFLGPPGTGKSHIAQAIGHGVIKAQGHRVLYREAHRLLEDLADATIGGERKPLLEELTQVPLLIVDDLVMRRYERSSTLITSNRPVEDWGKLLGDTAAVAATLDRLLHHAHVLKFGPRSWRTKTADLNSTDPQA
jgi:DNA replication protein DnaC